MASRHRLRDQDRPVGDGAAGTTIISKNITVIFVPPAIRPPEILSASKNFATSLGTSASALYYGNDLGPQRAQQAAELVRSFETIADAEERQICLDFVRSVAARQQPTS